eukprot:scaffold2544_cov245-Pinguiococcus_pyrenoidosus.AAC.3
MWLIPLRMTTYASPYVAAYESAMALETSPTTSATPNQHSRPSARQRRMPSGLALIGLKQD